MARSGPWAEAIALRGRWFKESAEQGTPSMESRPAADVAAWVVDLEGEIERLTARCTGDDPGDPREALVNLIAISGAFIDSLGPTT